MHLNELLPELFYVISSHLPLSSRLPTLLSLALTSRRVYDVIVPSILYENVRLVGDHQVLSQLERYIAAARAPAAGDMHREGDRLLSHYIRHLSIDSQILLPITDSEKCLSEIQQLADADGLLNLASLTLHIDDLWEDGEITPTFWNSLKEKCPRLKEVNLNDISQHYRREWIQSQLFNIQGLTSVRLTGYLIEYTDNTFTQIKLDLSDIPVALHTLELRISENHQLASLDASDLLSRVFPNLRTLILDYFDVGQPALASQFWEAHPGLERLELMGGVEGDWFEGFHAGMLPNLKVFKSRFSLARVVFPHISKQLVVFYVLETCDAQAPYLLRTFAQDGHLAALQSLGIQLSASANGQQPKEGHCWRENEDGLVQEVDTLNPARRFDGNYLMSVAKAAPNLEELELMGESDDTIGSITASLLHLPKLRRLLLAGTMTPRNQQFFHSSRNWKEYAEYGLPAGQCAKRKYMPSTFAEAAHDLADGCRTLDTITFGSRIGELWIERGLSVKVMRDVDGGPVKELRKIGAWGNIIGREEEW